MAITGTVLNGRVEFDQLVMWPDGSKVKLQLDEDEVFEYPHPMAPYDREKEIELIRESVEDMRAGRVIPFEVAMRELAIKHKLPVPEFD